MFELDSDWFGKTHCNRHQNAKLQLRVSLPADDDEAPGEVHPFGGLHEVPDGKALAKTHDDVGSPVLVEVHQHRIEGRVVGCREDRILPGHADPVLLSQLAKRLDAARTVVFCKKMG